MVPSWVKTCWPDPQTLLASGSLSVASACLPHSWASHRSQVAGLPCLRLQMERLVWVSVFA